MSTTIVLWILGIAAVIAIVWLACDLGVAKRNNRYYERRHRHLLAAYGCAEELLTKKLVESPRMLFVILREGLDFCMNRSDETDNCFQDLIAVLMKLAGGAKYTVVEGCAAPDCDECSDVITVGDEIVPPEIWSIITRNGFPVQKA